MPEAAPLAEDSPERVYLVGVRLHPYAEGAQLYTLLLMHEAERGDQDRPLTDPDGYVVWFSHPHDGDRALELADDAFRRHGSAPREVAFVYDYAAVLWLVTNESRDERAAIVDGLNFLLDLVKAVEMPLPDDYRRALHALADHTTFSKELGTFLESGVDGGRTHVMDALTWCLGAVVIKSRLI